MDQSEREDLASVFLREESTDRPGIDVSLAGDKYVRIAVGRRGLTLRTSRIRPEWRSYRAVYLEDVDGPPAGPLIEMADDARSLIELIDSVLDPIRAFVQRVHDNNPDPYFPRAEPIISHVLLKGRQSAPRVHMFVDRMGSRSGTIYVGERPLTAFDIGLHLNMRAQAETYRADIQRIVAAAQPMIDGAVAFARKAEPFMPPEESD